MNTQYYPIILQALSHLFLLSIMAFAFYVALRRTSLLGFRLLFWFAAGQLSLAVLGLLALPLIAMFFGLQITANAAFTKSILDYALYAFAVAGVISLMRNTQTRNA